MSAQIRIVLVETTHPGNIGAVARAMKNMCLFELALVSPKVFPSEVATARAAGAADILESARVCATLQDAVHDCQLVIGASARTRAIEWPLLTPRTCAERIAAQSETTQAAILFGREHSGLTNRELEACHYLLNIPCNPDFSSLNVAAAVQVVAYELYLLRHVAGRAGENDSALLATTGEIESFFAHLTDTLFEVGFFHPRKALPSLIRRLRRMVNRARLERQELHILRGILTTVQYRLKRQQVP